MNNKQFAIVVITFNRVKSLRRLINSLVSSDYAGDEVDLIISIDNSGSNEVADYAKSVIWPHGKKQVVEYGERLGLKRHVLKCGELTLVYENICVFEDDVYVSPGYYRFSKAAVAAYKDNSEIAGISLYCYQWNQYVGRVFCPVEDKWDVFFLQIASSWGQVWSKNKWREFVEWLSGKDDEYLHDKRLPSAVSNWSSKSWLKFHNRYLVDTNKYFVYPRQSMTTNFSDQGEHAIETATYQVPILSDSKEVFNFPLDVCSGVKYDAFFENKDLHKYLSLGCDDLDVSFYENKPQDKRYLVTTAICDYKIIKSFGMRLRPIEANIIHKIDGDDIFLYDRSFCVKNFKNKNKAKIRKYKYEVRLEERKIFLQLAIDGYIKYCAHLLKRLKVFPFVR